jgi:hypothetical protein
MVSGGLAGWFCGRSMRATPARWKCGNHDLFDAETNAHLLKYDTTYGRYRAR